MKPIRYFANYYCALFRCSPVLFLSTCLLSLLGALGGGIGLLLFIPLLQFSGWLPLEVGEVNGSILKLLALVPGKWSLIQTLAVFVGLIGLVGMFDYLAKRESSRLGLKFLFRLQQELNFQIAHAEWSYTLTRKLQDANHLLSVGIARTQALTTFGLQFVTEAIVVAVYLVLAFHLSVKLTLFAAVMALIPLVCLRRVRAHEAGKRLHLANQKIHEKLSEFLGGIKLAKSSNLIDRYVDHFENLIKQSQMQQDCFVRSESKHRFWFQLSSALIFSSVFYVSTQVLHIVVAKLVSLLILYSRLMPRMNGLLQIYTRAMHIVPVYTEVEEMISSFRQHRETSSASIPLSFSRQICFHQVSFAYLERWVLEEVSCTIERRTITAIVGPSGAGKTTFADLILGLLTPQEGTITVDGVPLGPSNKQSWRSLIGYVAQDPYFFNDTIRQNLLWLSDNKTDSEIWNALEMVAAADFVRRLPLGLDSPMGDRGAQLSGGEKQRLALARVLLRKPQVLLLDEATSALDPVNENWIQEALRKLSQTMTVILIAHRHRTIQLADQVLVLSRGKLIEVGTPKALAENPDSEFRALFCDTALV